MHQCRGDTSALQILGLYMSETFEACKVTKFTQIVETSGVADSP